MESLRLLVSKGQVEKYRIILKKFHARRDRNSILVDFEMTEIERAIADDEMVAKSSSWTELFSAPRNRRRAFISMSLGLLGQWTGQNIASYYLVAIMVTNCITSVADRTLINGCL